MRQNIADRELHKRSRRGFAHLDRLTRSGLRDGPGSLTRLEDRRRSCALERGRPGSMLAYGGRLAWCNRKSLLSAVLESQQHWNSKKAIVQLQ